MALFMLITWVPLVLLTAWEGNLISPEPRRAFVVDFGAHARYLFAGPLLLAAEAMCVKVLSQMARRLGGLCLHTEAVQQGFVAAVASTRKLHDAPFAAVSCVVIAYAVSITALNSVPLSELPMWHQSGTKVEALSFAGWWHVLISAPLLLMLILSGLWLLFLWTRFLRLVSRLDLNLIAVHPDRSAGIGFIGYSLRAFCLAGAALGAMVAGRIANQVLHSGANLADYWYVVVGLVVFTVLLFGAPLVAFSRKLLDVWQRAVREYGELATQIGRQFENEWLGGKQVADRNMLDRGDFSAATDLYQVVDRVRDLRIVPVDLVSVPALAGATLLPFVPIVFALFPFDELMEALVGLLL